MKASLLSVSLLLAVACAKKEAAPTVDTTAAAAPPAAPALVSTTEGFSTPEAVLWDAELGVWYVASINGSPGDKDNNGYISRLKADGTVDSLKFIEAGKNGVTLNGPKGMALVGDTLWVADIDAVRGFNRRTGAPIASIEFGKQAKFLNDIAVGPNGVLYVTDTGVLFGAKGVDHPGPDRVFTVTGRLVAVGIEGKFLSGPNGITWDGTNGRMLIASFTGNTVLGWKPGEATVDTVATGPGQFDAIEIVGGKTIVSSWADSSLYVVDSGKVTKLAGPVASPGDIGVDQTRGLVAQPLLMLNKVEFWRVK
jgi:sugar lactone lactonase YvrE